MREFKFKVWDKKFKMWLKRFNVDLSDTDTYILSAVELCQYTGLKDENGVEIYEGDIVRTFGKLFVVFYSQEHVGYLLKDIDGCLETIRSYRVEVLGNIYENPELLEEEK
ncbi:MAG: hypothetical protein HUJ88_13805 [Fusobacterium necrophorum]|nr:hypothetical protein [Fusobacterium necrophorum]